jgi:hypothetical protein
MSGFRGGQQWRDERPNPFYLSRDQDGGSAVAGDEVPEDDYEGVDCPACERIHFINRRTGKCWAPKTHRLNP